MSTGIKGLINDIERARRLLILGLLVALIAFTLFGALRGERFWNKIKGEGNLWNYGSSLVYFVVGELAITNAVLLSYQKKLHGRRSKGWLPWVAAGMGFIFFACDEMLEIHEKLGLVVEGSIPWLARVYPGRGDSLVVGIYALGAAVFSIAFFKGALANKYGRIYFIVGLISVVLASLMDLVPRDVYIGYLPLRETEELLELFAGWAFASAFLSCGAFALGNVLEAAGSVRDSVQGVGSDAAA